MQAPRQSSAFRVSVLLASSERDADSRPAASPHVHRPLVHS